MFIVSFTQSFSINISLSGIVISNLNISSDTCISVGFVLTNGGDQLILEKADEIGANSLKTTPAILLCQLGGIILLFRHGGSCCGDLGWFTWRDRLGSSGLGWFGC